jgi:hypothetical protein
MMETEHEGKNGEEEFNAAVDEALEDQLRAAELRRMRALLQERRTRLTEDLTGEEDSATRAKLERDLEKLDEQIAVLGEEAEITQFVEDAVRVGLEMRRFSS